MSDPQVPTTATSAGGQGMQDRPVTERDLSRYRSVMDKQLAQMQKSVAIERKRANAAEGQLKQILSATERQMLEGMKPEERQKYLAQKRDKDLLRTKKENARLKKQARLDSERDRVLRKYGLKGDEAGLDYSSWERFTETAFATAQMRQAQIQQALRKSRAAPEPQVEEADPPPGEVVAEIGAAKTAARVDTAGPIRVRPAVGSVDSINDAAWALTKGSPAQRKAALDSLRKARQEAVGA